jgi:hypothetical protein
MTLESSGDLNLTGGAGAPTRSIEFECAGSYTGYSLSTAQGVAVAYVGALPVSMTDFYGYTACADPTPGAISSVVGSDSGAFATCNYSSSSNADNYRVQYAESPFTNWIPADPAFSAASPFTTTLDNGTWKFRVAGENCSGLGPYTESVSFIMS